MQVVSVLYLHHAKSLANPQMCHIVRHIHKSFYKKTSYSKQEEEYNHLPNRQEVKIWLIWLAVFPATYYLYLTIYFFF